MGFGAHPAATDPAQLHFVLFASSKRSALNPQLFLSVTANANKAVYAPRVEKDGPRM
jgi:hypothetical protein